MNILFLVISFFPNSSFRSVCCSDREGPIFTTIVGKFNISFLFSCSVCKGNLILVSFLLAFRRKTDGANVAYYGHSNVHYSSLKKVVEKLESMGERPLVVMPEKYTSKSWACRPNFYQKRTRKDEEVIDW